MLSSIFRWTYICLAFSLFTGRSIFNTGMSAKKFEKLLISLGFGKPHTMEGKQNRTESVKNI